MVCGFQTYPRLVFEKIRYVVCRGWQGKVASWIPDTVFAALAVVTGILALLLPETLNRPLPETIREVESWTRSLKPPSTTTTPPASAADHGRPSPIRETDSDDEKDREDSTRL